MPDTDKTNASPFSEALEKLMANPEIISMVASSLGSINQGEVKNEAPQSEDVSADEGIKEAQENTASSTEAASASPTPNIGELMSSLAPMLSALKSSGGGTATPIGVKDPHAREAQNRAALLCALKPYVSEGRRDAIDYIIRISQVSDILKSLN